jgi:hypothetical protein
MQLKNWVCPYVRPYLRSMFFQKMLYTARLWSRGVKGIKGGWVNQFGDIVGDSLGESLGKKLGNMFGERLDDRFGEWLGER